MLVSLFPNTNLNNCLWIHFESWRDFTLRASTETEHDVDAADSRDEKRWMKQEIERKVKKMKKDEMARINLLVERAMAVDPRLRREKERIVREKKEKEDMKKRIELEKIGKRMLKKNYVNVRRRVNVPMRI